MNRPRLDPPVRRARRRRRWALAGVFALTAALIVVPSAVVRHVVQQQDAASLASFYEVPADLPAGSPGEIIRMRAIPEAPQGAQAWRIIYHTRDLQGRDIAASAVVVEPTVLAPHDGRVVVAWGHPTTGAAQNCAPSLATDPFELMAGLDTMLAAGFAVVAADYPGMGVAGASSYLLGVPESNSMLDAVRAARQLPSSDLSNQVLLWGHSQGGQASLFAAQRIGSYAPELHLVAVAVAAPAATLPTLLDDDIGDISGVSIASYAIPAMQAAYRDAYPTDDLGAILTSAGAAATPQMSGLCLLDPELHRIAGPLIGAYLTADPAKTEPWASILTENSAGNAPITVPIFIGQGLADQLVRPTSTEAFAAKLCAAGENLTFHLYPGVNHGWAAYRSLPDVLPFFETALHGTVTSTCAAS